MWKNVSLIKCEIHQALSVWVFRFMDGLPLKRLFFFFFYPFPKSDWSDQKYHQHQHWSLHPLHCHKEKCPRDKCFDVWGSVRRSDFTGGFTCIGLSRQLNNRSDFQTTIPAQWWTLTPWPEHLFHTTTKESVKNLAVNLLTQMKR